MDNSSSRWGSCMTPTLMSVAGGGADEGKPVGGGGGVGCLVDGLMG